MMMIIPLCANESQSNSQLNQDSCNIVDEEIEDRKIELAQSKKEFDNFVKDLGEKAEIEVDLDLWKDQFKFKTQLNKIDWNQIISIWERIHLKRRFVYQPRFLTSKSPKKNWSDDEINLMIWLMIKVAQKEGLDIFNIDDDKFEFISHMIPLKDPAVVKHKWLLMKQISLQQTPWTKEEDELLSEIYLSFKKQDKSNKWSDISKMLENKTKIFRKGKQCRERWNNYLDPDMNRQSKLLIRGNWSEDEDYQLLQITYEFGSTQWSSIAKKLSKRTENAVKNRFKSLMKKERKERIKNGVEVKTIEELTENIDKNIILEILAQLKGKLDKKTFNFCQEATTNPIIAQPPLFQMYFNPSTQYNSSQIQQSQQQNILINPHINQLTISYPCLDDPHSKVQQQQNQPLLQLQTVSNDTNNLQHQFQNLNLNCEMSPAHNQFFKSQILHSSFFQHQQQQYQHQLLIQQQNLQPQMQPYQTVSQQTRASMMQSLQSQVMSNHINIVQSPQFINSMQNNECNSISSFLPQTGSNKSLTNLISPQNFSEAVNSIQNSPSSFNNVTLNQMQNSQLSTVASSIASPFLPLATPTSIFGGVQLNCLSPTTAQIPIRGDNTPQPQFVMPKIPQINSLSCSNTPTSNRNKRIEKTSMFSELEKLQKLRVFECEVNQDNLNQEDPSKLTQKPPCKSDFKQSFQQIIDFTEKKAGMVIMNSKIEEEEDNHCEADERVVMSEDQNYSQLSSQNDQKHINLQAEVLDKTNQNQFNLSNHIFSQNNLQLPFSAPLNHMNVFLQQQKQLNQQFQMAYSIPQPQQLISSAPSQQIIFNIINPLNHLTQLPTFNFIPVVQSPNSQINQNQLFQQSQQQQQQQVPLHFVGVQDQITKDQQNNNNSIINSNENNQQQQVDLNQISNIIPSLSLDSLDSLKQQIQYQQQTKLQQNHLLQFKNQAPEHHQLNH